MSEKVKGDFMKKLVPYILVSDFIYFIGSCGAYENDAVTEVELIIRSLIALVIFLLMKYLKGIRICFLKQKMAYRSCNYNKPIRK